MDAIDQLLDIMARMRAEGGCPWDREQTLESLKQYLVEECYEVIDAVDSGQVSKHKDELGDLLLQVVFQAQIRKEQGDFSFEDVVRQVSDKLIRRHPHVFGDQVVSSSAEVLKNWETIKAREKQEAQAAGAKPPEPRSIVEGIPRHLPALHKAHHIQRRVARVGFDWNQVHDVMAKVEEELAEVKQALATGDAQRIREEIGDLLFAVVNLSRFQGLNAEEALNRTVDKFTRRFQAVEQRVRNEGREISQCSLAELDAHWSAVKAIE
ncbi:MAG: nucleoside triphosphate pyrophosphohydrolase [Verrucomicrobia bacterium]|nr:nucleoside triphosphate pyrophosphohydrolase [Verrucomicrobiota bacterium]MBU4246828.1 nucleoside triphosphate pyrophosphohydrolase [Verrucomicrobiota bacterium]MBU4291822.1 nucleoside triphosphate pyrophosphohydrolase [Verrucomicrobiota bacterium]MBU4429424.1 nucleoside triphosphate pyrophosphohydrolase [Verrucomicrobiota bacterium]MCG2680821.1 nucleoside triphosphate pyrophosphohydrolase [Kiritimatiellia bacterium]